MKCLCGLLGLWLICLPGPAGATAFGDVAIVHAMGMLHAGNPAAALEGLLPVAQAPTAQPPAGGWRRQEWVARFVAGESCLALGKGADAAAYLAGLDGEMAEVADLIALLRGRAWAQADQWAAAEGAFQTVLAHSHSANYRAEATYGVADMAYCAGDKMRAERLYHAAVRTLPRHPQASLARLRLAEAAQGAARFDQAADFLRRVADGRGEPLAPVAAAQLAALQQAGHLSDRSFASQLSYVDHLLSARSLAEATTLLQSLAPLATTVADKERVTQRQAQLALRSKDYARGISLLQGLVQGNVGRPRMAYQRELAAALAVAGDTQAAVAELDAVAGHALSPREVREVQFRAAWLLYEAGLWADAEARFGNYIAAHSHDRNLDDAMWLHAWNAYHRGDLTTAAARLVTLQARYPYGPTGERAQYWQGRILAQMDRRPEAVELLTQVSRSGTGYYPLLARQSLVALGGDPNALPWQRGRLVAGLTAMGLGDAPPPTRLQPTPRNTGLTAPFLPWADDAFDWQHPQGTRMLRLMQLGQHREAAALVPRLPILPQTPPATVEYARARLMAGLGDFAGGYRAVGPHLRHAMAQGLTPQTRRAYQVAYPEAHPTLVAAAAEEFGISPYVLLAVMRQESAYNDGANSQASARGLMQIIPITGRRIAVELHQADYTDAILRKPSTSVRFGAWYLAQLVEKFSGHLPLAIGSYNAGPQAVEAWLRAHPGEATDVFIEDIAFKETRNYVKQVLANVAMYALLYRNEVIQVPAVVPTQAKSNVNF